MMSKVKRIVDVIDIWCTKNDKLVNLICWIIFLLFTGRGFRICLNEYGEIPAVTYVVGIMMTIILKPDGPFIVRNKSNFRKLKQN
jgi:hypothetical protein